MASFNGGGEVNEVEKVSPGIAALVGVDRPVGLPEIAMTGELTAVVAAARLIEAGCPPDECNAVQKGMGDPPRLT